MASVQALIFWPLCCTIYTESNHPNFPPIQNVRRNSRFSKNWYCADHYFRPLLLGYTHWVESTSFLPYSKCREKNVFLKNWYFEKQTSAWITTSDIYCCDTPWYFHGVESPYFPLSWNCKEKQLFPREVIKSQMLIFLSINPANMCMFSFLRGWGGLHCFRRLAKRHSPLFIICLDYVL